MSVRLGVVAFLNARPLVASLESSGTFELSYSVPSVCATEVSELKSRATRVT